MTSVLGHIMTLDFEPEFQKHWNLQTIDALFEGKLLMICSYYFILAPILKKPIERCSDTIENIKYHCKDIDLLVLWLDCDREGEAIAFDVIDLCIANSRG